MSLVEQILGKAGAKPLNLAGKLTHQGARRARPRARGCSSASTRCRCTSPRRWARRRWRCSARAARTNGGRGACAPRGDQHAHLPALRQRRLRRRQDERMPDHAAGGRGARRGARAARRRQRGGEGLRIVRQRYNPYGGAERFVERALPALERARHRADADRAHGQRAGERAASCASTLSTSATCGATGRSRARRARPGTASASTSCSRTSASPAATSTARATACTALARAAPRRRPDRSSALGMALNPYHRYVCGAEKRMFEHPRLRAVICNSAMVRDEIAARLPHRAREAARDLQRRRPRALPSAPARRACATRRARSSAAGRATCCSCSSARGSRARDWPPPSPPLAAANEPAFRLAGRGARPRAAKFAELARRAGVAERVAFLGGRDDVRPYYAAADCFILPTRYDPFPNTALEALAMGLPAIVSSRCGAAEVIEPGASGWVCEPDDVPRHRAADARRRRRPCAPASAPAARPRAAAERFGIDGMAARAFGALRARYDVTSRSALSAACSPYVRPYAKVFGLAVLGMMLTAATEPLFPALIKPLLDGASPRAAHRACPPIGVRRRHHRHLRAARHSDLHLVVLHDLGGAER